MGSIRKTKEKQKKKKQIKEPLTLYQKCSKLQNKHKVHKPGQERDKSYFFLKMNILKPNREIIHDEKLCL